MKTITAKLALLFTMLLGSAPNVLAATSVENKITCEQVGDIALKVMYKRQADEQMESTASLMAPDMSWEDKILTAGIRLRATEVSILSTPDEKLESIVKFGELVYAQCSNGKLGLLQQYVGDKPLIKSNTLNTAEKLNIELLGRMSMLEQEYDSINTFRQATKAALNNIRTQINALAYGADHGVLQQLAEVQQALDSLSVDEGTSINSPDKTELITAAVLYIKDEIGDNWVRPANARNGMVVELIIYLVPTGEVVNVEVSYRDSSATDAFVSSVVKAVKKVRRFDKLSQLNSVLFDANFRQFTVKFKPEDLRL